MRLKKLITPAGLIGLLIMLSLPTQAAITLNIAARDLRTAEGAALMPAGGLLVLVASTTDNTFSGPSDTLFATGDDIVVGTGSTYAAGRGTLNVNNAELTAPWTAGDLLMLYWYPTLSSGASSPGAATPYGQFRTSDVIDLSDIGWITPAEGTSSLYFKTASAGGSNPDTAGYANYVTPVPEPGNATVALIGGVLVTAVGTIRRFHKRRPSHPLT